MLKFRRGLALRHVSISQSIRFRTADGRMLSSTTQAASRNTAHQRASSITFGGTSTRSSQSSAAS